MRNCWYSVMLASVLLALTPKALAQAPHAAGANAKHLESDPHLVGWWKLDDLAGTNISDSSGKNHAGVLENGSIETNSVPGRIAKALRFDGKNLSIRIPNFKGVSGQGARTVSAWLKTTTANGDIISWGSDEPGRRFTFGFFRSRVGVVPKGGYLYMNNPVHDDKWHHVAVVVLEAAPPNLHDHVKLYFDGERAEIGDIGLLDLWPVDTGDKIDVRIGNRFKGAIDDLRLYDRALSEQEITALFKSAK